MSSFPEHQLNLERAKELGVDVSNYFGCDNEFDSWNTDSLVDLCGDILSVAERNLSESISASAKANHLRIKDLEEQKAELLEFIKSLDIDLCKIADKGVELYGKLK